jgi:hypothetical protein
VNIPILPCMSLDDETCVINNGISNMSEVSWNLGRFHSNFNKTYWHPCCWSGWGLHNYHDTGDGSYFEGVWIK